MPRLLELRRRRCIEADEREGLHRHRHALQTRLLGSVRRSRGARQDKLRVVVLPATRRSDPVDRVRVGDHSHHLGAGVACLYAFGGEVGLAKGDLPQIDRVKTSLRGVSLVEPQVAGFSATSRFLADQRAELFAPTENLRARSDN